MSKRKAVEKIVLDFIKEWLPDTNNAEQYKKLFARLSDKEFQAMMEDMRDGKEFWRASKPNNQGKPLNIEHTLKVMKKHLDYSPFERVWMTSETTGLEYLTVPEYLNMHTCLRTQNQLLQYKIAIPRHTKAVDHMTGQPTGESKGSQISLPEAQVIMGHGLSDVLVEGMGIRAGDARAMEVFDNTAIETGVGNTQAALASGEGVKTNVSLSMYLKGMHLDNDIAPRK